MKRNIEPIVFAAVLSLMILLGISCTKEQSSSGNTNSTFKQDQSAKLVEDPSEVILFFGNSLTAGYGVNPEDAFPYLIQQKLDSLSWSYKVVNAGLSGETTASGANRIEWVLREPVSIMILELGGNDGLRGIDPEETRRNLQQIIDRALTNYPDMKIIIAGMEAPPNMGNQYTTAFRSIFPGTGSGE